jgi:hypothetical protein
MSFKKALAVAVFGAMLSAPAVLFAAAHESEVAVTDLSLYYKKEGLDYGKYNAVLIGRLGVEDARVVAPPWVTGEDRSPQKWQLTGADIRWLRKSYREAMRQEIEADDGYPVVNKAGDGVLIVDIEIIYLMPYARKGENVTVRGFGEMLVQAQLRDGMTGELLGLFEGTQEVGSEYQQNTRLNAENDLRDLFSYWGSRVRGLLDQRN